VGTPAGQEITSAGMVPDDPVNVCAGTVPDDPLNVGTPTGQAFVPEGVNETVPFVPAGVNDTVPLVPAGVKLTVLFVPAGIPALTAEVL